MSYILDALRKADLQRRRHAAPTLLTLQPSADVHKRKPYVAYGLLATVLIGAGIVIGWWRPWQTPLATSIRSEPVVVKPRQEVAPQPSAVPSGPVPSAMAPQQAPQTTAQNEAPSAQTPRITSEVIELKAEAGAQSAPQPVQVAPATTSTRAATKAEAEVPPRRGNATSTSTPASPSERLAYTPAGDAPADPPPIALADLPQAVRQDLPAMNISVHAWSSNPAASLIGINYKILHEGDYVTAGLQLEQITPDGAVFTYKGYRFSRGLK